jgi:hypothetical protein
MEDNSPIELRIHRLNTFEPDELEFILSHTKETVTLEVPCPAIGSSYRDTAYDLLDALFVGETIAEFCNAISFYGGWDETQKCKTINFVFSPQNSTELAKKLHWLSFRFREWEEDNGIEEGIHEEIIDFQEHLGLFDKKKLHFPLLADDYFSNYMASLGEDSYDAADDISDISEIDKNNPAQIQSYISHKYNYLQSMYEQNLPGDLYYSLEDSTWIVFSDSLIEIATLEQLLENYRNHVFKPLELQEASVIATQTFDTIVLNKLEAVKYPFERLTKAQECVAEIYSIKNGAKIDISKSTRVKKNLLSSYGDILIVVDQMAQYIFFGDLLPKIPMETLSKFAKSSSILEAYLNNLQENLDQRTQKVKDYNEDFEP